MHAKAVLDAILTGERDFPSEEEQQEILIDEKEEDQFALLIHFILKYGTVRFFDWIVYCDLSGPDLDPAEEEFWTDNFFNKNTDNKTRVRIADLVGVNSSTIVENCAANYGEYTGCAINQFIARNGPNRLPDPQPSSNFKAN